MWVFVLTGGKEESISAENDPTFPLMAVVRLTCEPSCLKMSFHLPQGLAFSSTHSQSGGKDLSKEIWSRKCPFMGLSLQKVQLFGPKSLPHKQNSEQLCVVSLTSSSPQVERMFCLYCLAARKFSNLVGYCYPHYPEPHSQSTKQRAAFLLWLMN